MQTVWHANIFFLVDGLKMGPLGTSPAGQVWGKSPLCDADTLCTASHQSAQQANINISKRECKRLLPLCRKTGFPGQSGE